MTSSSQNSNDFFGCKICCLRGVPFNESTLKAHLQTKGHKFMKVLFENDLWPEPFDSSSSAASKKVEPKIFRFLNAAQSTAILCRLCGCVLNDANLLFDHQLDESHKKNLTGLTAISCPTVYFCPPCDVMVLGIENYSAHCSSSGHNKNLDSAYQTSGGGQKFLLPDDPKTNYKVTVKNDKYSSSSRKRSKSKSPKRSSDSSRSHRHGSSSSSKKPKSTSDLRSSPKKPKKHHAEEKPKKDEPKKPIAGEEDDPLRSLVRKLAKNLEKSEEPKIDTTSKNPKTEEKPKKNDAQHEATTAAKSTVVTSPPKDDQKTTTTLLEIDFLQQKIENDRKLGDQGKIDRLTKFIDFLTNQIRDEKSILQIQVEKIRELENLVEKYRNEKSALENPRNFSKEQILKADTVTKLAILMKNNQEKSIDNQSITVENSTIDQLLVRLLEQKGLL